MTGWSARNSPIAETLRFVINNKHKVFNLVFIAFYKKMIIYERIDFLSTICVGPPHFNCMAKLLGYQGING